MWPVLAEAAKGLGQAKPTVADQIGADHRTATRPGREIAEQTMGETGKDYNTATRSTGDHSQKIITHPQKKAMG